VTSDNTLERGFKKFRQLDSIRASQPSFVRSFVRLLLLLLAFSMRPLRLTYFVEDTKDLSDKMAQAH
jgi:hypothetical protein